MSVASNIPEERSSGEDMDIETESTGKRSLDEAVDTEMKKVKIETPVLEKKVPTPFVANTNPPGFVSAATMVTPAPKSTNEGAFASEDLFTDEELLKYAMEFERQYGLQYPSNNQQ